MEQTYYTLITDTGLAKEANAHEPGQDAVVLSQMAIGDGNGSNYEPSNDMTSLKNEVYRTSINQIYTDPEQPNQLIIEGIIPPDVGGFTIREVGIIDSDGDFFAIGNYPETLKPVLTSGAGKDVCIRMILAFSTTPEVTLTANTDVVIVTRDELDQSIDAHNDDITSHHGAFDGVLDTDAVGPLGLPNRYFDTCVTDYGNVYDSQPFATERISLVRSDLARAALSYDYGDVMSSFWIP